MLCSIHNHTTFCDGANTPAEMAAAAYAAGVHTLGFSGHSYLPAERFGIAPEQLAAYRAACAGLKRQYAGRMEVLCGMEIDADTPAVRRADYDYVIGSVHSVKSPDGALTPVDDTPGAMAGGIAAHFGGSGAALAAEYYAQLAAFLKKLRPDVVGHFDLVRKFNAEGAFFDENSAVYRTAALTALEEALLTDAVFEVNTGAISRGWQKTPYPDFFLLRRLAEAKARVTVTADAHSADTLLYGAKQAAELLRAAGFTAAWNLTADGWREEKIEA